MLALAAARLGFRCHAFAPDADSCAFDVVHQSTCAAYDDHAALARFADSVDLITYEFENIPAETAAFLAARRLVVPDPHVLAKTQDRMAEKNFITDLGIATAPFAPVQTAADLAKALATIGLPAVLKTSRLGYDGKGQKMLGPKDDPAAAWAELHNVPCILEGFVPFEREISVVAARSRDGQVECFDVSENEHSNHILKTSRVPAAIAPDLAGAADHREARARLRLCRRPGGGNVRGRPRQRTGGLGQRNRPARAQFRALEHRRLLGVAIRAAYPRGGGLDLGQAGAARSGGDDQPDRHGSERLCPLAGRARCRGASLWQDRPAPRPQDGPCDPGDAQWRQGVINYILGALISFLIGWSVAAAEVLFRDENRPSPFAGTLGMLFLLALAAVGAALGTGGILWMFQSIPSAAVFIVIAGGGWLGFAASNKLQAAAAGAVNRLIVGLGALLLFYGLVWRFFPPA
jgi:hypothetical protein